VREDGVSIGAGSHGGEAAAAQVEAIFVGEARDAVVAGIGNAKAKDVGARTATPSCRRRGRR